MGNTDALIAQATQMIDGNEEVLAAGQFELQEVGAMVAGSMVGSSLGGSGLGGAGGAIGMIAGQKAYAESQGLTERLIVAVTPTHVLLLNGDTSGRLPHLGASFDRSTCTIKASSLGPFLTLHLEDPATGQKLKLGGATFNGDDRSVETVLKA